VASREWTVAEANAALARVAALVEQARDAVRSVREARVARAELVRRNGRGPGDDRGAAGEAALRAVLGELEDDGIVLRDVDRGLVDFPARSPSGRSYLLCWVVGEPEVAWWHWPEDGFPGRTPLSQPPG
jgi:hypothetical protein